MEIGTEQMDALLRLQEQQATERTAKSQRLPQGGMDFGAMLTDALDKGAQGTGAAGPMPLGGGQAAMISQMLLGTTEESQATDPDNAVLMEAFSQASGTLDLWDKYASTLGKSGNNSLREAYSLLEGIDSQVAQLRENTAGVRGQNAGLDSLLNELSVMTATEKFKFNRGDYA